MIDYSKIDFSRSPGLVFHCGTTLHGDYLRSEGAVCIVERRYSRVWSRMATDDWVRDIGIQSDSATEYGLALIEKIVSDFIRREVVLDEFVRQPPKRPADEPLAVGNHLNPHTVFLGYMSNCARLLGKCSGKAGLITMIGSPNVNYIELVGGKWEALRGCCSDDEAILNRAMKTADQFNRELYIPIQVCIEGHPQYFSDGFQVFARRCAEGLAIGTLDSLSMFCRRGLRDHRGVWDSSAERELWKSQTDSIDKVLPV